MDAKGLQQYIYEHIPIIQANHFTIEKITQERVWVKGSYQEHINHRDSVFGGSISTAMTLAAWSRVRLLMEDIDPHAVIVIQDSHVRFLEPVLADFTAVNQVLTEDVIEKVRKSLSRFRKARLHLKVDLYTHDSLRVHSRFEGDFVIVTNKDV